jgi:transposase-like protein
MAYDEFVELRQVIGAHSTPQAIALRARIILRCIQDDKPTNERVAADLGCDADTVSKWRRRFHCHRLDGLQDHPRSGRPRAFSP